MFREVRSTSRGTQPPLDVGTFKHKIPNHLFVLVDFSEVRDRGKTPRRTVKSFGSFFTAP